MRLVLGAFHGVTVTVGLGAVHRHHTIAPGEHWFGNWWSPSVIEGRERDRGRDRKGIAIGLPALEDVLAELVGDNTEEAVAT